MQTRRIDLEAWMDQLGLDAVLFPTVAKHYITGGNYPVGGAIRIAETIIPVIEAAGGQVFTYAGVDKIIVENGRAVGVRLQKDGVELRAPQIVSCAGWRCQSGGATAHHSANRRAGTPAGRTSPVPARCQTLAAGPRKPGCAAGRQTPVRAHCR